MPSVPTYDKTTQRFHWATAILVLFMWLIGQAFDFVPEGNATVNVMSAHFLIGFVLAAVVMFRLIWRFSKGQKLPNANEGFGGTLAKAIHHTLYLLLASVLATGAFAVWVHGYPFFDFIHIPEFDPGNESLKDLVGDIHGLLANILLGLSAGHGLLAMWHHFVKKDNTLKRMI
jgi:cytochrome b561